MSLTIYFIILHIILTICYSITISLIIKKEEAKNFMYFLLFYLGTMFYIITSIVYAVNSSPVLFFIRISILAMLIILSILGFRLNFINYLDYAVKKPRIIYATMLTTILLFACYSTLFLKYDLTPIILTLMMLSIYIVQFAYGIFFNILPFANRQIINNMDEYIILIDKKGYIVRGSTSIIELFLEEGIDILGKESSIFLDYLHMYESEEIGFICSIDINKVKGQAFSFKVRRIIDNKNRDLGKILIVKNVTKSYTLEKQLEKARNEIIKATKEKSMFLANLSHEIRTPMNAILGMTQFFIDVSEEEKAIKTVEEIETLGQQLYLVVNNLLDYSKIEAKQMNIDKEEVDLDKLISEIESKYYYSGLNINKGNTPIIIGDYLKMQQLISLIVEYIYDEIKEVKADITIEYNTNELRITYKIYDNINIVERLYELFSIKPSSKILIADKRNTLNIALWVEIIYLLSGNFKFFKKNQELIIKLTLPVEILDRELDKITIEGKDKVLIVDDNEINRKILGMLLSNMNIKNISYAEDGAIALEKCKEEFYKVIFMDCYMPVMDGYTAAYEIGKLQESNSIKSSIVAVTANDLLDDKEKCLSVGIHNYLTKPINVNKLKSILKITN